MNLDGHMPSEGGRARRETRGSREGGAWEAGRRRGCLLGQELSAKVGPWGFAAGTRPGGDPRHHGLSWGRGNLGEPVLPFVGTERWCLRRVQQALTAPTPGTQRPQPFLGSGGAATGPLGASEVCTEAAPWWWMSPSYGP